MALYGMIPAFLLHKRQQSQKIGFLRTLFAAGIAQLVCSAFLNTLWLYILTQVPMEVIWFRWITAGVSWPVYAVILYLLLKYKTKYINPALMK